MISLGNAEDQLGAVGFSMKVETFVEQGLSKSFLAWFREGLSTHPVGSSIFSSGS